MNDEEFKAELTLFAKHVEGKKARGILVDLSKFYHKMGADAAGMEDKKHLESL